MVAQPLSKHSEERSALVCVDGITRALVKGFTPDISWSAYVKWVRQRRPGLEVIHLEQPNDWMDIITGKPDQYDRVEKDMLRKLVERIDDRTRQVVIFGFSLGGLTALQVVHEISRQIKQLPLDYAAYVSFGTPFKGTGRMHDYLLRYAHNDYFQHMFDVKHTKQQLREIVSLGHHLPLRILLGEIDRDEMVSASSALRPVHWLSSWHLPEHVRWGTFLIENSEPVRAHDGLLYDPLSVAYIDGLVDALLPPEQPVEFEMFRNS